MIVDSATPVTLLGGAPIAPGDLEAALDIAPTLICADGGADVAIAAGHVPAAVIGDFDSISEAARGRVPAERQHPIAEQDSTDFDKCLRNVRAPLVLGVGFLGARVDHHLAALSVLVRRHAAPCLLLGSEDVVFNAPARLNLDLPVGCRVSLFPMAPVTGVSEGLRWPIDGLRMSPDGQIGTSNEVVASRVRIAVDGPGLLVLLPRTALDAAVAALSSSEY
ncbi:thiamine diphosphokinase [Tranquillimonas rosea]|uniref:thiamine diphosphokinase n=1 Tax=Tranquillimonas rosea TaxID=641238 RepID=UPI003BAD6F0C